jgi:hypothetical protein
LEDFLLCGRFEGSVSLWLLDFRWELLFQTDIYYNARIAWSIGKRFKKY